jgi:hypothetical protein
MLKSSQSRRMAEVCIVLSSLFCLPAHAELSNPFELIDAQPVSETWLNPGFYSYHWQRERDLHDENPGFGAEYRFSTVASATVGEYLNSDRVNSKYAGFYYQPVAVGSVRLGLALGGFDGYPEMKNGGWFLAAIPVASFEYKSVGLNLSFVPSYKDRLYGALSFQLKLKVF